MDVLPGRCDDLLDASGVGGGVWPWAAPVRTLSVAMAATNRTSSERCGMSLLLTQDTSDSELERSGDSLPRFAPGGSSDARIRAGVVARLSYALSYAVLVVPGALLLHVIVVTMFSTPLACSESLCVVFIVTVGPGPVMPRHKVRTAPSVKRMPSQKAHGDPKVLPECHERLAPNGTSGKAETAAPGRHERLLHGNCVVSQPGHPLYPSAVGTRDSHDRPPHRWTILRDGTPSSSRYTRERRSDNDPRRTAGTTPRWTETGNYGQGKTAISGRPRTVTSTSFLRRCLNPPVTCYRRTDA